MLPLLQEPLLELKNWMWPFGSIADPSAIFGDDLVFWFDNSNGDNITLDGTTVESQTSEVGSFIRSQSTGSAKPEIANGIITPDGVGEFLDLESPSSIIDDTLGFIFCVWNAGVADGSSQFWNSSDDASNSGFIIIGVEATNDDEIGYKDNATNVVDFNGVITRNTSQIWVAGSDGSAYKVWVEGLALSVDSGTDNGNWMGDIATVVVDNITFGSLQRSSALYYAYEEKQLGYINRLPTAKEIVLLQTWADSL